MMNVTSLNKLEKKQAVVDAAGISYVQYFIMMPVGLLYVEVMQDNVDISRTKWYYGSDR